MAVRAGGEALLLLLLLLLLLPPLLTALLDAEPLSSGDESERAEPAEPGLNALESTEPEFGECTVTCGIGIQEVLLTSGCPGDEAKCIVGVKECRGPVDCGWGRPISENSTSVMMTCIYISPENRFKYVWKMLIPDKPASILPNDSAVVVVRRATRSVTYLCETQENGSIIASVKYAVKATTELKTTQPKGKEKGQSRRRRANAILVFCVVTAVIVTIGVIFVIIFIILHWAVVNTGLVCQDDKDKKLTNKSAVNTLE
ncbi:sperm acrosome membrane-associated protein 1 isoform X1 [Lagopus muta]|uniref:sperm acrosome membrane-associated protein 1 isoform X1 n=1 Tax=Lagopus muta TaxID=64668 RepID=UPI00209CF1D5|nr:sperm acrosome membrane-associated protein 1 isoform X1 [Lagopus muta]